MYFLNRATLKLATLNIKSLQKGHKAAYLSSVLLEVCNEWQIPITKITAIDTDHRK